MLLHQWNHDSTMEDHPPKTKEITKNKNENGGILLTIRN